jgi:hypothetical protein
MLAVVSAAIGLSPLMIGMANADLAYADPTQQPAPGPATTSTTDELADMVMGVIQHGNPVAPSTTPVPAPPR